MRKLILAGAAIILISGCSKKETDSNGDGKISADEVKTELSSGGKMAMKPGLWEIKINFTDISGDQLPAGAKDMMMAQMGKGMTNKSCMTEEQVNKPGGDLFGTPGDNSCTFNKFDRNGNKMTVDMTCKPAGGMTLNSKMEGEFGEESYKMSMEQQMEGAPMGKITMKGNIEGKRLGACPT